MKRLLFIALLCGLAVGCNKKTEDKPEKADKSAEKAKDDKPKVAKKVRIRGLAPDSPRSRGEEIPTSEDFEEEASRTVALENLDAELDRLEAEIVAQSP
jgi:hypothetical protein